MEPAQRNSTAQHLFRRSWLRVRWWTPRAPSAPPQRPRRSVRTDRQAQALRRPRNRARCMPVPSQTSPPRRTGSVHAPSPSSPERIAGTRSPRLAHESPPAGPAAPQPDERSCSSEGADNRPLNVADPDCTWEPKPCTSST
eukprot:scaffold827_cov369-Prasinococcus_capsulatus_cf.AAC.4